MKKEVTLIIAFVIIICVFILSKYFEYKEKSTEIRQFNVKYEQYLNKEIYGTDIASIINQAVDDNEKVLIKKDDKGKYIQDDEKSVNIEIKITDLEEKIYSMETFYNGGISEFVNHYDSIKFKCIKYDYNSKGKIKYMLFEQIMQE